MTYHLCRSMLSSEIQSHRVSTAEVIQSYIAERLLNYSEQFAYTAEIVYETIIEDLTPAGTAPLPPAFAKLIMYALDFSVLDYDRLDEQRPIHGSQNMNHDMLFDYVNNYNSVRSILNGDITWTNIARVLSMVSDICLETLQHSGNRARLRQLIIWAKQFFNSSSEENSVYQWIENIGGWNNIFEHAKAKAHEIGPHHPVLSPQFLPLNHQAPPAPNSMSPNSQERLHRFFQFSRSINRNSLAAVSDFVVSNDLSSARQPISLQTQEGQNRSPAQTGLNEQQPSHQWSHNPAATGVSSHPSQDRPQPRKRFNLNMSQDVPGSIRPKLQIPEEWSISPTRARLGEEPPSHQRFNIPSAAGLLSQPPQNRPRLRKPFILNTPQDEPAWVGPKPQTLESWSRSPPSTWLTEQLPSQQTFHHPSAAGFLSQPPHDRPQPIRCSLLNMLQDEPSLVRPIRFIPVSLAVCLCATNHGIIQIENSSNCGYCSVCHRFICLATGCNKLFNQIHALKAHQSREHSNPSATAGPGN